MYLLGSIAVGGGGGRETERGPGVAVEDWSQIIDLPVEMWRFKCEIIVIFSMNNLGISLLESPVVVRCPLLPACYLPHRFFAALLLLFSR